MMQESDNENDRLEGLLRQWGADEARKRTDGPAMPPLDAAAAGPGRVAGRLGRWLPLAAAVVLAAGVAFWIAGATGRAPDRPVATATQPAGPTDAELVKSLRGEVAALRGKLADANSRLATADERVAALSAAAAEATRLRDEMERARLANDKKVADLEKSLADEQKAHRAKARELAAAEAKVDDLAKTAETLKARSAELAEVRKQAEGLEERLAAAGQELLRRRKAEENAEASLAEARRQAQALKVRHREIVRAFQRTYLASVAPGESGVEARKTAARARHMIERLADLSSEAHSDQTHRLLDRIDAVLTRLDLMNADRPGSAESLQRLVRTGDLAGQIDAALAAPGVSEDVKNWLFEAKLILTGGPDAG